MLGFIKKNWKIVLILALFPIIFIGILKLCIKYLPGEMIGTIDGWLGFLGGYFGVLGAIGTFWWQLNEEKKSEIKGLLFYIMDELKKNLNTYNLEYIEKINNQACSLIWLPNYTGFNLSLNSLALTKEEILLLYKHDYHNLIKLNSKIDNIIKQYKITEREEFIYQEVDSLINDLYKICEIDSNLTFYQEIPTAQEMEFANHLFSEKEKLIKKNYLNSNIILDIKYIEEIKKFFIILTKLSEYFYYYPTKNFILDSISLEIKSLKKDIIFENIFSNPIKETNEFYKKIKDFFNISTISNYNEAKDKYCIGLHILTMIVRRYNIDLGKRLTDVNLKKINFFNGKFKNLYVEIDQILKILEIKIRER